MASEKLQWIALVVLSRALFSIFITDIYSLLCYNYSSFLRYYHVIKYCFYKFNLF